MQTMLLVLIQYSLKSIHIWKSYRKKQQSGPDIMEHSA